MRRCGAGGVSHVEFSAGAKHEATSEGLFSTYGDLAQRLLPSAVRISFFRGDGRLDWSNDNSMHVGAEVGLLIAAIAPGGSINTQVQRLSDNLVAVALPIVLDSKCISILAIQVIADRAQSDRRVMRDTASAAAPLIDCLCREIGQIGRKATKSATLSERTEELEWLFSLTENLHSNSNDPKAIQQLLGAAVERMKCCFGAVIVPEHGVELKYSSMVRIDVQADGAFDRIAPFFMSFAQRRKQPLVANKLSITANMPPFKIMVVPIEPVKDKIIGYLALLKPPASPNFGRRQLFLARHLSHQIGALLESQYDLATGLLTRKAFEQDIHRLFAFDKKDRIHSLLYFDIDRLHVINDTMGFAAGDDAIIRTADLLRPPALPENAIACRIGGDSFVVFVPDHDAEQACARAQRVLDTAAESFIGAEDGRTVLNLSCGVVRLYALDSGISSSLATAELACNSAKQHGGQRVEVYLDVDDSMMRRRHDVFEVATLRSALAENRFCIHAQKVVAAGELHEVRGFECLVRMIGDHGMLVPPGDFMPSAQRYQMLQAIDNWVISKILRELKPYRSLLLDARMSVSINISGQSLQDEMFIEAIERWLLESMIAPGLLRFEISETIAISNLARAERLIRKLRQIGCGFALDDFGNGVNSLSYLKCLPVSSVKIDNSCTRDLLQNDRSEVVVQTIVRMAKSLNIETVAECIESAATAQRLHQLGVDCVQGFVAHRPEPLMNVLENLKTDESTRLHKLFLAQ